MRQVVFSLSSPVVLVRVSLFVYRHTQQQHNTRSYTATVEQEGEMKILQQNPALTEQDTPKKEINSRYRPTAVIPTKRRVNFIRSA